MGGPAMVSYDLSHWIRIARLLSSPCKVSVGVMLE